tara:strand:+ start:695 stop:868 length:174 start_codon:yes stop_codon:yes gene_type:complete
MDEPKYLIINPLRIDLINERTNKITQIEEMFYNKMEKLKNISLQNNFLKKLSNLVLK